MRELGVDRAAERGQPRDGEWYRTPGRAALHGLRAPFVNCFLFRGRSEMALGLRDLPRLPRAEEEQVFSRAADSLHATLHATVVSSAMESTDFGLLLGRE